MDTSQSNLSAVAVILQARMSSSRLPGKVLRPILGKPMLQRHLERVSRIRHRHRLIVATSSRKDDEAIAGLCLTLGVECYRGSLDDVLDRYYQAARRYNPEIIVRLTGDCPLADPEVIDRGLEFFLNHDFDYVSNSIDRTYPIGLDVEIFRFTCLEQAAEEAVLPSEREHVTPFIHKQTDRFKIGQFTDKVDRSQHRWTVDEPEDFEFVKAVYENLYPENPAFGTSDIFALLDRKPELTGINYHIVHGEGYQKSLEHDAACSISG